ncbi:MAG: DUF2791 family P-loop domain-containing protein [Clostridiaceae bacterium]|nr:DUF2791 family P-loop domain-containing protein [Clostridiaceae bacterium]
MILENDESLLLRNALEHIAAYGISPPGTSHLVDVGTDAFLSYYQKEIIQDLVAKGGATCKFIEGSYGSGKTHVLQLLREVSLQNGMAVASTDLSQALSLSDWKLITEYILMNIEARINGQIVKSLPEIVAALGKSGANKNIEVLKKENLPSAGFKNAIIYALRSEILSDFSWNLLKQYLLGNKVSTVLMRNCGLGGIKGNLTQKNAEYVLKTVLAALYSLGLTGTALLFDENEMTLVSTTRNVSKKNIIAANIMRRMIDGCSNGLMTRTIVVFAVLPGFLENCAMNYQALGQRLQIVRDGYQNPSWRWPVLPIQALSTAREPEDFLEKAVERYVQIVQTLGGSIEGLKEKLFQSGQSVIDNNVGTGYKRELVKVLANISLERL